MALTSVTESTGNYVGFKASIGFLTQKSNENDPSAKPRTYKDPKTDESVTVYERRFQSLSGKLVGVRVDEEGEYGTQLILTVRDDKDYDFAVSLKAGWGQKIAEAVPNINLGEDVSFVGFADFTIDGKDIKAGVSMKQNGKKVPSKFNNKVGDKWVTTDGFPASPDPKSYPPKTNKDKWTKFWNDYFFSVTEFLVDYIKKNNTLEVVRLPKAEDDINPEDIPF